MRLEKKMEDVIWTYKKVLVTGGTSFIGSHLPDTLVERGAQVRVLDDLTSGRLANIKGLVFCKQAKPGARRPGPMLSAR
jgi:nucleoside-diphosphate-sugar epimerase